MTSTSLAMVQLGANQLEQREFPLPSIDRDSGLLRIERCGLCGTDVDQFRGGPGPRGPVIPGHEPVGIVEKVGEEAARRWGVQAGDRVVLEAAIPCRHCDDCAAGRFSMCTNKLHYGNTPVSVEPFLYGGYAEWLYLPANATLHPISKEVPLDLAAMFNLLAGGVSWSCEVGGVGLGDTLLILGSGQRGIACGIAAKAAGADTVIMTGRSNSEHKFAIARQLGIDVTINVKEEDLRARVAEITGGRLVDVVIDLVPDDASTVVEAIDLVKPRGTVVIGGHKSGAVPGLLTNTICHKEITIKGVRGKPSSSYQKAIRLLESMRFPFERLEPRTYALADAAEAIDDLAGLSSSSKPRSICVSLAPGPKVRDDEGSGREMVSRSKHRI